MENVGIAVNSDSSLMAISNCKNHTVTLYALPSGDKLTSFGGNSQVLHSPTKLCFTCDGTLLIAEFANHRLQEITAAATCDHVRFLGAGEFTTGPTAVAASHDVIAVTLGDGAFETVFVLDRLTGRTMHKFGARGSQPGCLDGPSGLSFTPDGRFLVIAELYSKRISIFDTSGDFVASFGESESQRAYDVCVTDCGKFAVAHTEAHTVTLYSPDTFEAVGQFRPGRACASLGSYEIFGESFVLSDSLCANPHAISFRQGKLYSLESVSSRVEVFE